MLADENDPRSVMIASSRCAPGRSCSATVAFTARSARNARTSRNKTPERQAHPGLRAGDRRHSAYSAALAWTRPMDRPSGRDGGAAAVHPRAGELLSIARSSADPRARVEGVLALDPLLRTQGLTTSASSSWTARCAPCGGGRWGRERAAILASRGQAPAQARRGTEGAADLKASLGLIARTRDPGCEGRVRASLGMLHGCARRQRGERESRRAVALAPLGRGPLEHVALNTIGIVRLDQGRLSEAERYFAEAIASARADGRLLDRRDGTASSSARYSIERGNLDEAAARFKEGRALNREVADRRNQGIAEVQLASVEHERGNLGQALAGYRRARLELRLHARSLYGGLCEVRASAAYAECRRLRSGRAGARKGPPVSSPRSAIPRSRRPSTCASPTSDLCRARRAAQKGELDAAARHLAEAETRRKSI